MSSVFIALLLIAIGGGGICLVAVGIVVLDGGISRGKIAKAAMVSSIYFLGTSVMIVGYHHLENRVRTCLQLVSVILTLPWSALVVIGFIEELGLSNPLPLGFCAALNALIIFILLCRKSTTQASESGWRGSQ